MTDRDERIRTYVGHLLGLAEEGRENRGALADLRSGLGRPPAEAPRMHRHVVLFLGDQRSWDDRWFYVVGALFAYHPVHTPKVPLAASFGALRRSGGVSDSADAYFTALLSSHPEDLPERLRRVVGLLRSHQASFDWFRLLNDLTHWTDPSHTVPLDWARQYYRALASSAKGDETPKGADDEA
jgi:CRISPR system Cascade subunit CasB